MKLTNLYESILNEEYDSGNLYGYHVTTESNLESINKGGFKIGSGSMQGKGVYAFYDIYEAKRYASKGEIHNPVIIKFKITRPRSLLIINTEIAKEVFGSEYHLVDQVDRKYWGGNDGMEGFLQLVQSVYNKEYTMDDLVDKLNYIETNNSEGNQRTFWSYLIPSRESDRLDLMHNGNYGVEYRINRTNLMYPMGYHSIDPSTMKFGELIKFEKNDEIPSGEEYDELRKAKGDLDLNTLKEKLEAKQHEVRNNYEFDLLGKLINQISKLTGY